MSNEDTTYEVPDFCATDLGTVGAQRAWLTNDVVFQ